MKYLGYRKMLRNLIRDHPTSPDYLSTTHKNYKVDRTAGSSRIREPRTEIDVFDNPKNPNHFRNRLIIYQNDRSEKCSAMGPIAGPKGAGRAATVAVRVAVTRRRAGPVHFRHGYYLSKLNNILDTFLNWS